MKKAFGLLASSVAAIATLVGAASLFGHYGSAEIKAQAPTPADFMKAQNIKLSASTIAMLEKYSDVRVIEYGSPTHELYKRYNPYTLLGTEEASKNFLNGDMSYLPKAPGRFIGIMPVIFMSPYTKDYAAKSFKEIFEVDMDRDAVPSEMAYVAIMMHELGHHDLYKKDPDKYFSYPARTVESYADLFSIPPLVQQFGDVARSYVINERAFTIKTKDHDVLPSFKAHKNADDVLARTLPETSYKSAKTHFDMAVTCYDDAANYIEKADLKHKYKALNAYDMIYMCYKVQLKDWQQELKTRPITDVTNDTDRALAYMKAYQYFFPSKIGLHFE